MPSEFPTYDRNYCYLWIITPIGMYWNFFETYIPHDLEIALMFHAIYT